MTLFCFLYYSKRERCFIMLLSFVNMGLAAMMGALGILTLIKYRGNSVDDLTVAFLAVYMVIFATILFIYELIWWGPIAKLNKMYRKNFGFMYGLTGKGLYLVCIAFLCLGLKDKAEDVSSVRGLDWATGIGWLAVGFFHVFIACIWPELVDVYRPPTAGLTGSETDHVV